MRTWNISFVVNLSAWIQPVCIKVGSDQMSERSISAVCTCSAFACSCFCFRLLVGAPRAKAFPGQTSNTTGGLYSCDLSRNDCSRVQFDNTGKVPTHTRVVFPANVWVLILACLCRGPSQRKQANAVDGRVGQQPGPGRQGHGKTVWPQRSGSL